MNDKNKETSPGFTFFTAVFLLSAGVLCLEIIAGRVFAIMYVHDFSFMIVSLAILGLGLGGIFAYYRWRGKHVQNATAVLARMCALFAAAAAGLIVAVTLLPAASSRLFGFLILLPPFFFAGVSLSLAFRVLAGRSFVLYAADLLGAASGSLLSLGVLETLGGIDGVLFCGVVGAGAALLFLPRRERKRPFRSLPVFLSAGCFLLFALNGLFDVLPEVPVGPDRGKELYNMLYEEPLADIMESRWSSFGRTDLATYRDYDEHRVLFLDGGAGSAMYRFSGNVDNPGGEIDRLMRTYSGYYPFTVLDDSEKESMLVIGPGGGKEVLMALVGGAGHITGVEINRDFVDIVRDYSGYNGGLYSDFDSIDIVVDEGRSFLRGSPDSFDIIMFSLPFTKSLRSIEEYALSENYLLTVESIHDYLDHLSADGRLVLVLHNFQEMMRFVTTALAALEERGIGMETGLTHIYTLGRGRNPLVVLKKSPFTPEEAAARLENMNFFERDDPSTSFLPHIPPQTIKIRRNGELYDVPMFNEELSALASGRVTMDRLIDAANFDQSAATDNRPFFFNLDKGVPGAIRTLLILVVVITAAVAAIPALGRGAKSGTGMFIVLFLLLGAGFMLVEIAFLQKLTLFLGSTSVSLSILLAGLLSGMGMGSFAGDRFLHGDRPRRLRISAFMIAGASGAVFFVLPLILTQALSAGLAVKAAICLVFLVPLGFLFGMPFPTAIRLLHDRNADRLVPWMYGVNGAASVLGSVTAVAVSHLAGFSAALAAGVLLYAVIGLISR